MPKTRDDDARAIEGTVIPDGARRPTDRRSPAQVEADGGPVDVEYAGETYTFPAALEDADGSVLEAIDDQKLSHAIRGLLSAADLDRFRRTHPRVRDYAGLFEAYARRIGLDSAGE